MIVTAFSFRLLIVICPAMFQHPLSILFYLQAFGVLFCVKLFF